MSQVNKGASPRIVLIDALRGFALLGILLSHFNHWYVVGPLPDEVLKKDYGILSTITELINSYFISNKFYVLFSFIFGLSFYLQTVSFKKYPGSIDFIFFRRAFFLFVIGAIHYSIWLGDILVIYAILMVPLIFFRRFSDKNLLITGVILVLNIPVMLLNLYHSLHTTADVSKIISGGVNPFAVKLQQVVSSGGIKDMIQYDLSFIHTRIQYQIWSGSLFLILGFFVLGMFVARNGWLQKTEQVKDKLPYIVIFNIIALIVLQKIMNSINATGNGYDLKIKLIGNLIICAQSVLSVIMNVSLVAMLYYHKLTYQFANRLADLGRMALTNYLIQTLIGLILFYNIGFGLFGKTTPGMNFFIAIFIFIFQLGFSRMWFRYFNYGIVEWLLRAGTLWEFKEFRKK